MKYTRWIFLLLIITLPLQANNFDAFNKSLDKKDTKKARKLLDNWGAGKLEDPQYYICEFNYYVRSGMHSGMVTTVEPPESGESLELTDPKTGEVAGYMYETVTFNDEVIDQGIEFIHKGIEKFPDHYEMRFGLLWILKELKRYDPYLDQLDESLAYYRSGKFKTMYWNENKRVENPGEFLIERIQGNLNEMLSEGFIKSHKEFAFRYADLMIQYFPDHKYGYSNKGVIHFYNEETDQAIGYFLKALEKDPEDELTLYNIAYFYDISGNPEKAEVYYQKVIDDGDNTTLTGYAEKRLEELTRE